MPPIHTVLLSTTIFKCLEPKSQKPGTGTSAPNTNMMYLQICTTPFYEQLFRTLCWASLYRKTPSNGLLEHKVSLT